jgi:lipoyl(octanoyl) transferase
VNTDLSYFGHIVPCGITDKPVTSLEALTGTSIPLSEVKERILVHFGEVFNTRIFQP